MFWSSGTLLGTTRSRQVGKYFTGCDFWLPVHFLHVTTDRTFFSLTAHEHDMKEFYPASENVYEAVCHVPLFTFTNPRYVRHKV